MRVLVDRKAVSTFILVILILCSAVFGALLSYLWVMANYYNMPEDETMLIVTDAVFPPANATYFNVTILNPSNSISDANITVIRLSVEGKNEVHNITATEPGPLPFLLKPGTAQTFKCKRNWSNFAGENVRIEPVAANVSTISYSYPTPNLKLKLKPTFEDTESAEYFNLTIENSGVINLTLSEIFVFGVSISENVTPPLTPLSVLSPGQRETFQCNYSWAKLLGVNVTITVKTAEGYESAYTTNELPGAVLYIDEIRFDYADTSYFNLTVTNTEDSTATALLNRVNLTVGDEPPITLNTTYPFNINIIPIPLPPNQSSTLRCLWDWNTTRNETITVSLYTQQGFTVLNKSETTPQALVWNITRAEFDLDYTEYFLVYVKNMPCSLQDINVTSILLGENETIMDPPFKFLTNGTEAMFNCTFDWKNSIGQNVTVTVLTENGLNSSITVAIPSVGLKLLGEPVISELLGPYVNITISNSNNSLQNVTITRIVFETEKGTFEIDGTITHPIFAPDGYLLKIGEKVTIVCRWSFLYLGASLKVTVYTAEGIQTSRTWLR